MYQSVLTICMNWISEGRMHVQFPRLAFMIEIYVVLAVVLPFFVVVNLLLLGVEAFVSLRTLNEKYSTLARMFLGKVHVYCLFG